MKLKDLNNSKKPQEKLLTLGSTALTDVELLAVVLRVGTKGKNILEVAEEVLERLQEGFEEISVEDLCYIPGVGPVRACQIIASIELSKRYLRKVQGKKVLETSDVVELVPELRHLKQEHSVVLTLDSASCLIKKHQISIGTVNASLVHPREVFSPAIEDRADSIILVHNHPSGEKGPSQKDVMMTRVLSEVSGLLGIQLLDHIIVARKGCFSFRDEGMMGGNEK